MINGSDRVFGRARSGPETSNPPEFAAPLRGGLEGVPFQAAAGIPFHVAVANKQLRKLARVAEWREQIAELAG